MVIKPWYSKLGPLTWYKNEWVKLTIATQHRLILSIDWMRRSNRLLIHANARILHRGMHGGVTSVEGGWHKLI